MMDKRYFIQSLDSQLTSLYNIFRRNHKKTGGAYNMIYCEVELCMYNNDYKCTLDNIEIETTGKCYQCMPVLVPEEAPAYEKICH